MILGESDAVKMRKLAVLLSSESSSDDCRVDTLENLEFIVESLDNANGVDCELIDNSFINLDSIWFFMSFRFCCRWRVA